jgi:hypothetical protein
VPVDVCIKCLFHDIIVNVLLISKYEVPVALQSKNDEPLRAVPGVTAKIFTAKCVRHIQSRVETLSPLSEILSSMKTMFDYMPE